MKWQRHHLLYLCYLLMDLSVAGVTFAFSRRAAEMGASALELGWLGAVWMGVYALAVLVTGVTSDRIGRVQVARAGCVVCVAASLAYAFFTDIRVLLAISVAYGIGLACFWPPMIAWLGEDVADTDELNARLSNFSIAFTIGLVIGFSLIGLVYTYSPRSAFFITAVLYAVVAGLITLAAKKHVAPHPSVTIPPARGLPPVPQGRGFRKCAWLANFALCFSIAGVSALFPQLATSLHIQADVHGSMLAVSRFASLVAFVALQFLICWRTRLWPLWVAQLAAAGAIAWLGWADSKWMFFTAFAVAGLVSGYTYQASIYFTLEEVSQKGQGVGYHEAILGFGSFAGPLLAGWVGQHGSLRAPYWFCAAALVGLVAAQMLLVALRRRGG